MTNNEQTNVIKQKAEALIAEAQAVGVVLTIELKPLEPLAMGHYRSVAETQFKHGY